MTTIAKNVITRPVSDRISRIRYIRKALALTQAEFAPILGVHRVTLANIERGEEPGEEVLQKIDAYLGDYDRKHRKAVAS